MAFCPTCDRIHGFCDKYCDNLFPEKLRITDNTPIFRVKGKIKALLWAPEICRKKVISRFPEISTFLSETILSSGRLAMAFKDSLHFSFQTLCMLV